MSLTADTALTLEVGNRNSHPVAASTIIYAGAMVGLNATTGYARPLTAGDKFLGIAEDKADNSTGAAGTVRVRVIETGKLPAAIASLVITSVGAAAYASDDATVTLTATDNSKIGVVSRYVSNGVGVVTFEPFL